MNVLDRVARSALAAPRRILVGALLLTLAAALFGAPVTTSLSAGGMRDPAAESSKAAALLADRFGQGDMSMMVTVSSPEGVDSPGARATGSQIVDQLAHAANVGQVLSPWTGARPRSLVSEDGKTGLIVVGITGTDNDVQKRAKQLAEQYVHDRDGVTVRAGGEATIYWQINEQTRKDLLLMEALAMPLSFVALLWVFGGLFAAALPLIVGVIAVVGSMAALRALSVFTDVSIFSLNLSVALGLALAIDYTLLILTRYRDEQAAGATREIALVRTMVTAGRTVLFSAMTVVLSMATMVIFPQYFLRSFAYAGVAVVASAALAAIVVTPAVIVILGDRLDSLNVRRLLRRLTGRPEPRPKPVEQTFWYRCAKFAMRYAVPVGLVVVTVLLLLGTPFMGVRWGFPDDRMLPPSASSREVGDALRNDFAVDPTTNITVVLPDTTGVEPAQLGPYAAALSEVPDTIAVSSPVGTFVEGKPAGPPSAPTGFGSGAAFLTVSSRAALFSVESAQQVNRLRAVAPPAATAIQLAGVAPANQDSVHAVTGRTPMVLAIIAVITLVLLFLLTGSVVLPVKAVVMNVLSLTAAFGAVVWVFQEGHFGALGSAVTGTLEVNLPVLLFCVAFGLSMDYEVFLISRIREYWLLSGRTTADNEESVALGVARTGRVITAAALLMSIAFAALMAAQVSFMRLFGFGLTVAVLVDATLVRMLLVPAFMKVMGRLNWWAPAPLTRLHRRFGLAEVPARLHVAEPAMPTLNDLHRGSREDGRF
jgi:putative drug exporter of the RND superfamily